MPPVLKAYSVTVFCITLHRTGMERSYSRPVTLYKNKLYGTVEQNRIER